MPLQVDYNPVGAMGSLASAAGYGAARSDDRGAAHLIQLQNNLANQSLAQQDADLRKQSFRLQQAHAERVLAGQLRTPAAEHVSEQALLKRQARQDEQIAFKTQLDKMLSSGAIDDAQYQKGLMAAMTNNETLMAQVLAAPKTKIEKPRISNTEEVNIIRRPFREKRGMLQAQLRALNELSDPKEAPRLRAEIEALFEEEATALGEWRESGVMPSGDENPQGMSPEEIAYSRSVLGSDVKADEGTIDIRFDGKQAVAPQSAARAKAPKQPAPPVAQRVVGEEYALPNGKVGIWRGTGWEVR